MVSIQHKVSISYNGGPEVLIPSCLLVADQNAGQFLKLRASHPNICKLVAGPSFEEFKGSYNMSLAQGSRMLDLKDKVQKCIMQAYKEAVNSAGGNAADADDFFQDAGEETAGDDGAGSAGAGSSTDGPAGKKRKVSIEMPSTATLLLEGKEITVLAPASGKQTDVTVKMDSDMLKCVLDYLHPDAEQCFKPDAGKRGYKRRR